MAPFSYNTAVSQVSLTTRALIVAGGFLLTGIGVYFVFCRLAGEAHVFMSEEGRQEQARNDAILTWSLIVVALFALVMLAWGIVRRHRMR